MEQNNKCWQYDWADEYKFKKESIEVTAVKKIISISKEIKILKTKFKSKTRSYDHEF